MRVTDQNATKSQVATVRSFRIFLSLRPSVVLKKLAQKVNRFFVCHNSNSREAPKALKGLNHARCVKRRTLGIASRLPLERER